MIIIFLEMYFNSDLLPFSVGNCATGTSTTNNNNNSNSNSNGSNNINNNNSTNNNTFSNNSLSSSATVTSLTNGQHQPLQQQQTSEHNFGIGGDRICFNFGKELYVYAYRGVKKVITINICFLKYQTE